MLRGVTIGCGYFSRIQMEAWQRVRGAQIVAACDLDRAKAEEFAADFRMKPYTDLASMFAAERPDFADIVTRPSTHLALAQEAVRHSLPILLQKPVAETWEDAVRIVEAAAGKVRLMINENWRWQSWYRAIGELIRAGRIGRPFGYAMQSRVRDGLGDAPYPHQPYFKDMPRLLVFETLVHHLDTARFLFGDIEDVYCQTAQLNPVLLAEDFAQILTRHRSGVLGVIDGNRFTEPDEPGPALESARFEGADAALRLQHSGDVWLGSEKVFDASVVEGYRGDSCLHTQQHFVDCLASDEPFESEGRDYVQQTFAAVEACYRSAAERRPVTIAEVAAG